MPRPDARSGPHRPGPSLRFGSAARVVRERGCPAARFPKDCPRRWFPEMPLPGLRRPDIDPLQGPKPRGFDADRGVERLAMVNQLQMGSPRHPNRGHALKLVDDLPDGLV